jgi:methyl coenzyme M reductase alpha subunit
LILKNTLAHEGYHVRQGLAHDKTLGPSRIGFYSYDFWVPFKKKLEIDAYDFQLAHPSINNLQGENYPNYINDITKKKAKYK